MWRGVFYLLVLGAIVWYFLPSSPTSPAEASASQPAAPLPGLLAPGEPVQTALDPRETGRWMAHGDTITPLARYDVKARVMHVETYGEGRWSEVSPVDFALGWGRMADPAIYGQLHVGQHDRWYFWSYRGLPPLPDGEIIGESANTHLIPATSELRSEVLDFKAGDMVELEGYLVRVDAPDGWFWTSSLSRTDTGEGSCEVMWVEKAVLMK